MTEREKYNIAETKQRLFARDGYRCQNCGGSIYAYDFPQLAHKIANSLVNIKRYGKEVIHHDDNLSSVCCLKCNDAKNIGMIPIERDALAERIKEKIRKEGER
jgi:5-methylcytosine-specific restriction endonuclease McrA